MELLPKTYVARHPNLHVRIVTYRDNTPCHTMWEYRMNFRKFLQRSNKRVGCLDMYLSKLSVVDLNLNIGI